MSRRQSRKEPSTPSPSPPRLSAELGSPTQDSSSPVPPSLTCIEDEELRYRLAIVIAAPIQHDILANLQTPHPGSGEYVLKPGRSCMRASSSSAALSSCQPHA